MLLVRRGSWRALGPALLVALWPGLAVAQAQVEAVPEAPPPPFDMWNLEGIDNPALELPDEPGLPEPPDSIVATPPATPDAPGVSDPCRHFTEEERRLLPGLCGGSD